MKRPCKDCQVMALGFPLQLFAALVLVGMGARWDLPWVLIPWGFVAVFGLLILGEIRLVLRCWVGKPCPAVQNRQRVAVPDA